MHSRLYSLAGSQDKAPRYLYSLSEEEYVSASTEQILNMSTRSGGEGLVDLRLYGAGRAACYGRMDLLTHFIETRKVAVNTITKEERTIIFNSSTADSALKENLLYTPLSFAIIGGQEAAITYLLNRMRKVETETKGPHERTCLTVAAQHGNLGAVRRLVVEFEANYTSARCARDHSPICYAADKGRVDVIDFFLEHARTQEGERGRDNLLKKPCPCTDGFPLLYRAISSDQLPVMQYIADKEGKKSFINVVWLCKAYGTSNAISVLHAAAAAGSLNIVKWLCRQGASVNLPLPGNKHTPIHMACNHNNDKYDEEAILSVVKYLIEEQHADWRLKTSTGHTAADLARKTGNSHIEAYLKGVEQEQVNRAKHAKEKNEEQLRLAAAAGTYATKEGAATAGAGETAAIPSGDSTSTNIPPPRHLHALSEDDYKMASTEEILKMSTRKGIAGLMDMRVYGAAPAARLGRMDLLTHFIETRKVAVNTITKEERALLDKLPAAKSKLKKSSLVTPLSLAITEGQEAAITYLLNRMQKAETETKGEGGRTCLTVAAQHGNLGAVRRLVVEFDANYTSARCVQNHSPVCYAVDRGHVDVIDFFLEHARYQQGERGRENLLNNACPCMGGYPLIFRAIESDQPLVLKCITEKADMKQFIGPVWARKTSGTSEALSALHFAAATGKLDSVKWLCEQGASADLILPKTKYTPLHMVCNADEYDEEAKLSVVKYLIEEQHADWQLKTGEGLTAADLARETGNDLIETYLKGVEQEQAEKEKQAKEEKEKEVRLAAELEAEKLRLAAAAADQAAASLLVDLDAEAAATAARQAKAMKASAAKKKKKAQRQNGKKDEQKQENEKEEEKEQKEADNLGVASSSLAAVAAAMGDMSIEEKAETATSAAAVPAVESLRTSETDDVDAFDEFLLENAPDALICPISFRLLTDPVIAQDTHTYDRKSLEQWMARCKAKGQELISPKNNLPMAEGMMCNQMARTMALDYMEAKKKEWEETSGGKMKG